MIQPKITPQPNDLFWWCDRCQTVGDPPDHPGHGGRKVERQDLPALRGALRARQAPLFAAPLPSELEDVL